MRWMLVYISNYNSHSAQGEAVFATSYKRCERVAYFNKNANVATGELRQRGSMGGLARQMSEGTAFLRITQIKVHYLDTNHHK